MQERLKMHKHERAHKKGISERIERGRLEGDPGCSGYFQGLRVQCSGSIRNLTKNAGKKGGLYKALNEELKWVKWIGQEV